MTETNFTFLQRQLQNKFVLWLLVGIGFKKNEAFFLTCTNQFSFLQQDSVLWENGSFWTKIDCENTAL